MNLSEFYHQINGDLQAARRRFYSDTMLCRFLVQFLDEPSGMVLQTLSIQKDRDAVIRAVHTLIGQAAAFGFDALAKNSAALVQALRDNQDEQAAELRFQVTGEYIRITRAIRSLDFYVG